MGKTIMVDFLSSPHGHWQVDLGSLSFPADFQLLTVDEKRRAGHEPGEQMGLTFTCDIEMLLDQQRVPTCASMLSKP